MKPEQLVKYEAPSISEYISIGWMQSVIAWYIAQKVNYKMARYNKRIDREVFINKISIKDKSLKKE